MLARPNTPLDATLVLEEQHACSRATAAMVVSNAFGCMSSSCHPDKCVRSGSSSLFMVKSYLHIYYTSSCTTRRQEVSRRPASTRQSSCRPHGAFISVTWKQVPWGLERHMQKHDMLRNLLCEPQSVHVRYRAPRAACRRELTEGRRFGSTYPPTCYGIVLTTKWCDTSRTCAASMVVSPCQNSKDLFRMSASDQLTLWHPLLFATCHARAAATCTK